jgi:hypothetical protein
VLALQRAAGNAAVTARLARKPATLEDWEEQEGVEQVDRLRLDDTSTRALQGAVGTEPTGWFKGPDAQALSHWRVQHGLPRGGTLSLRALDALIRAQSSAGMQDELVHLVADFFDLDLRAGTLSVRFDPALTTASAAQFDGAGLKLITVGPSAFTGARGIHAALKRQLDERPIFGANGAAPSILTAEEAQGAAESNAGALTDARSVQAVRAALGAKPTSEMDAELAQFVAAAQRGRAVVPNGLIDDAEILALVERLQRAGEHDALIRLVVDYHRIGEPGMLDVKVDPALARPYQIVSAGTGMPTTLTFGPASGDPAAIVHTIAHAYEDVRLRRERRSQASRDFLATKLEVMSKDMPEEALPGFAADAEAALGRFLALERHEQLELWEGFVELRQKVSARLGPTTGHEALQGRYGAVTQP